MVVYSWILCITSHRRRPGNPFSPSIARHVYSQREIEYWYYVAVIYVKCLRSYSCALTFCDRHPSVCKGETDYIGHT